MEFHNTNTVDIPIPSRTSDVIRIPQGVESIPNRHYEGCDQLELVCIPKTVRRIGDYAFKGCSSLKMVYIPEGVSTIGFDCFCNCVNMTIVHIPHSVDDIGCGTFQRCKSLCSVMLPPQLRRISSYCFYQCKMLNHIIIPPTVTEINSYAFGGCTSLMEINFPNNMIKLGENSFSDCIHLKKISFLSPLTTTDSRVPNLGRKAFMTCQKLVDINLSCYPVYTLKESCFQQCESLERVILSKTTKKIMEYSFARCSSLKYIGYETSMKSTENSETTFGLDLKHIEYIAPFAFAGCTSLESVRLYDNSCVQERSFIRCKNLTKISLPSHLCMLTKKYIHTLEYDFFPSSNITELILPSKAQNFSSEVIFDVMYHIIQRNPCLLTKKFTPENLYPYEVVNAWLAFGDSRRKKPHEDWIHNVLYHYIRNAPWLLWN